MASLVAKKKGNKLYYYVVESARVDGQPRIVHQAYLGTAEKVADLVRDRTSPVPVSAASREFGLPGALWLAAQQTGLFGVLEALWPAPRSGTSPGRYLLLAAIHRICQPGPKTEVADWYGRTILHSVWGIPPERFTSQAFWDAFEKILPEYLDPLATGDDDPLDQAQLRLLDLWKGKQMVGRRLLAYDTTNFYTYIASNNTRNELAQRGHNKQGRHNLRQVGLSYVLDGENGLSLCHHVLSRQCGRRRGILHFAVTHAGHAGSLPDRAEHGHVGVRQRFRSPGQHRGATGGGSGLDFSLAVESSPGGLPRARGRTAVDLQ
jgi:hypothetical protein